MTSKKVVVIGAGAAGLMAGATAALYGASVTIIEKNKRVGRKILQSMHLLPRIQSNFLNPKDLKQKPKEETVCFRHPTDL